MRAWGASGTAASVWSVVLLLTTLLWTAPTVHAADGPTIVHKEFENPPGNLNYFKGSNVVLFQEYYEGTIWRSTDGGANWKMADGIEHDNAVALVMHEYDDKRAYILTDGRYHWKTDDRGETWKTFFSGAYPSIFPGSRGRWFTFHATDPDKILFTGMECEGFFECEELTMYTTDGFETDAEYLRGLTQGCWWAKRTPLFTTGQEDLDDQRIMCVVRANSFSTQDTNRLVISDNYFRAETKDGVIQEYEPNLNSDSPVQGIVSVVEVKKYLLAAARSRNTAEMALYVSGDTIHWHRAIFPHDHPIFESSYTVLESTNYSIQIDVKTSRRMSKPMGTLLTSNSNGTYFTRNVEHTNRNFENFVDFEKVTNIQGIFLVNQVGNWEDVQEEEAEKKVKTMITFDDGRTFESVMTGDEEVHLHSVTELNNVGHVFSSPAPGLVMGTGNHGKYLKNYNESNVYVSDDAGRTWIEALQGPHKYEFGDQGSILLAIKDEDDVKEIRYSLDHGKNWETTKLPNDISISPWTLTTEQESSSLKFLLTARKGSKEAPTGYYVISIDFEGLHEDKCNKSDMEEWYARVGDDGKAKCVMGHKQKYTRRKKDAKCFIKEEFKDPLPESDPCDCTDADFECDFNFVREDGECVPAGPIVAPDDACKADNPDQTFMGSSGWRLIPGNECKRIGGDQKDKQKEWKCSDAKGPPKGPGSDKIEHVQWPFEVKGSFKFFQKHYLERGDSSSEKDETIIARPIGADAGDIWITHDHGKNWTKPHFPGSEPIERIITHPYVKDMVFFLTKTKKVYYTIDHGKHIDWFEAQDPPDLDPYAPPSLAFHPDRRDWLIWHGIDCSDGSCHRRASLSLDRGDNWGTVIRYVGRCQFTGSSAYRFRNDTQIVCLARTHENNDEENNPFRLLYSDEYPRYELSVALDDVINYATMAEFIVVAAKNETGETSTLSALASVNGRDYAPAHFPYNFEVPHSREYTVLDSSTHAINLFVETSEEKTRRFGTILKSNSNGTSYVLSIGNVNCDNAFYADFEKMLGLEGVALVNTVENIDSDSEPKRLQTKISHNDGANWGFLPPPERDLDGNKFSCDSEYGDEACALHIHGYTERIDYRKTYSSESAIGIMFGIGNVGPILGDAKDADTFMTTDAGFSWEMVKKGSWTWSFGDQGTILVLAQRNTRSKSISYSLDQGDTWEDYTFSETEVDITDITTLRSGSSRNFLLWGHDGNKAFTVNVDFSGLANEPCKYDEKDEEKSDYELWSPHHPLQPEDCLFGHKNYYLRKKKDRKCYNDRSLQSPVSVKNCECIRQDFECDYNFEMDKHGQCKLVDGLQPLDPEQVCRDNPDEFEYYEPSGFRRIPLTTCKGGFEADKVLTSHPCPGHEEEFERKRGASGVAIFFAVVIPICFASLAGWWVYRNWQSKFGQIRLGEQNGLDSDAPWIKYPVVAVSAVVAVIGALPLLLGSLWRSASSAFDRFRNRDGGGRYSWLQGSSQRRFTTRDSFARGRGDYAIVDEDEGELLGDDSDEEV